MSPLRWKQAIPITIVSFLILLAVDVAYISSNPWFKLPPKPSSDGPDYESIGWGLSHGLGLASHWSDPNWQNAYLKSDPKLYEDWSSLRRPIVPRTDRPPLLPVVVAAMYSFIGVSSTAFAAVRIFLALCLALSGAIAILIAQLLADQIRPLGWKPSRNTSYQYTSVLAALLCFTYIINDSNTKRYMEDFITELPAFALTQLFMVTLLYIVYQERPKWSLIVAGLLFGLMIYTRSLFITWIPGLLIVVTILRFANSTNALPTRRRWIQSVVPSLVMFAVTAVLISPWCIRNCMVLNSVMPLGTKGPITLLGGYCDQAYDNMGNWQHEPERHWRSVLDKSYGDKLATSPQASIAYELELVQIAKREVRAWISANLSKLPMLAAKRLYTEFNPYYGIHGLAKIIALIGAIIAIRQFPRAAWTLLSLLLINAAVVASLYSVGGRFLVPLYGVIYVFFALGATYLCLSSWEIGRKFLGVKNAHA